MNRRNFLKKQTLAGAAVLTGTGALSMTEGVPVQSGQPFKCNYAIHEGMFANSAGPDFIDQINYAYEMGFRSIEDNGLMGRSVAVQEKIGTTLASRGMDMGVFVISLVPNSTVYLTTGKAEWKEAFLKKCREAVEVARRVNAKWMTVVPGNFDRSLPEYIQMANVIEALRPCAELLEKEGLVMVLEPLSDTPDLFLRTSPQTYAICKAVNSPACKILFDMYHLQKNEGHVMTHIDLCWDEIAYFQIGDNPGRKEPGTGEMNYRNIFRHIYQKGFRGILGMEHGNAIPGKEGEAALIAAYRDADAF
jgi:hydroxypyruvate isomerase